MHFFDEGIHMRIGTKALSVAAAATLMFSLAACGSSDNSSDNSTNSADQGTFAQDSSTLIFGAVPDQAGSDSNWKPLEDYIAKKTGLKVVYKPTTDYAALITAAVAGQVDVAAFSGATYVNATNKGAKLDVVAAQITSPGLTTPGYYSDPIVATKNASKITSVAQFAGKKVCFVDPSSTSGFLYPLLALKTAGIDVTPTGQDANGNPTFKDFTAYFAGAHDKSVAAVASGQCDVGFAEDTESEASGSGVSVVGKDNPAERQLVPGGPTVISDALPASLKTQLTSILGTVSPTDITNAGISVTDGFTNFFFGELPENSSYYKPIYDACGAADIAAAASAVCGG